MVEDTGKKDGSDIGTIGYSRTPEQYAAMRVAADQGICPFCHPETWKKGIIKEFLYWRIKHNDFPYDYHLYHLVIILKRHEADITKLTADEWQEFGEIATWAIKEFNLPGGGIVIRFGDPKYNASTIRHIHGHIQVPDLTGNAKATFAKDPAGEEKSRERVAAFEKATK